jgi:hypothetical protein
MLTSLTSPFFNPELLSYILRELDIGWIFNS